MGNMGRLKYVDRSKIKDVVKSGRVLVSDGAWGTYLHENGLQAGECPEKWCLDRPDDVKNIAKSYIEAGADMVETDSFGGSSIKLEHYGLADRAADINMAATQLSREAAGSKNWVIGSIGPTGKMLIMGDVSEEELYQSFKEQAIAIEKGGGDAVCIETMSAIDEATIAVKAAKENTDLEIICTFTFEKTANDEYRTMMGVSPTEMTRAIVEAGADIIGTNCGNGIEGMVDIVREIKAAAPEKPILVHANAGIPILVNGVDTFPESPEFMASQIPGLVEAGANIIGGCCGTTPAHISAIKEMIQSL